jgi:hypothetical protein
MTRAELEHIIRAAAGIADTTEIVVIGSQAILGTIPDAPDEVTKSMEADVFPKGHPETADVIDGAIGEESIFHKTFGYYAHGVAPETAILPAGAFDRLVPVRNENTRGNTGWCLEIHDLAASKLAAGREKDIAFVIAMVRHKMIDAAVVRTRLETLSDPSKVEIARQRFDRITPNA